MLYYILLHYIISYYYTYYIIFFISILKLDVVYSVSYLCPKQVNRPQNLYQCETEQTFAVFPANLPCTGSNF